MKKKTWLVGWTRVQEEDEIGVCGRGSLRVHV